MKVLGAIAVFAGTLVGLAFICVYVVVVGTAHTLVDLWRDIRRGPPLPP